MRFKILEEFHLIRRSKDFQRKMCGGEIFVKPKEHQNKTKKKRNVYENWKTRESKKVESAVWVFNKSIWKRQKLFNLIQSFIQCWSEKSDHL